MANGYDHSDGSGGGGFMMGLLAGTVLGAGLGMLLAPKAGAELRDQLSEQARNYSNVASEKVRKASEAAGDWAKSGREMMNNGREVMNSARDAAARGAEEVRTSYEEARTSYADPTPGQFGAGPKPASDLGRS